MVDERLDRTMSMEGWATTHTSNGHEHDTNVHGLEDHEHEGARNDPYELVFWMTMSMKRQTTTHVNQVYTNTNTKHSDTR